MLDSLSWPKLNMWQQNVWRKKAEAFVPECCIIARLKIVDKDFWIDGAVLELNESSAVFREAAEYILRRDRELVTLEIESEEIQARVVSTDQQGYLLAFMEFLPPERVADLKERWRIDG